MDRKSTWIAALVALLLVGCAQAPPSGPMPSGARDSQGENGASASARQVYLEEVHGALDLTCTWCHAEGNNAAPVWLAYDPEEAYAMVEGYSGLIAHPDNSLLILQGEHMGPALAPKQQQIVRDWLLLEAKARGLTAPVGGPADNANEPNEPNEDPVEPAPSATTAKDALDQFSDCMDLQQWEDSKMHLLAHQQTSGWGPCRGCHNTGWAGAFLEDDSELMFTMTRQRPYLLKFVTAVLENGNFADLTPSDRFRDKGVEPCTFEDPTLCHPKYTLNPEVQQGITDFFDATYAAWKSGSCGN